MYTASVFQNLKTKIMTSRTIQQVQTEIVNLERKHSDSLIPFDAYNQERIRLNREFYGLIINQEFEWICETWKICQTTYERIGFQTQIIIATSAKEARIKLDKHSSIIKKITRK
jgi:hypothetical protein